MNILEKKIVNNGRQNELDIAKGLAILFMIAVHIQSELGEASVSTTIIGGLVNFLGTIPAAPVFMFLLGTGIVFSKKSDPKTLIKRGIKIIGLGYLLNILRTIIVFLPLMLFGDISKYTNELIVSIVNIDILQFAGLAFVFFGVIKKINLKLNHMVILVNIISILNYILLKFQIENYIIAAIIGLFWGANELSAFPFATWIFYPVAGFFFGEILIRQENKDVFYKKIQFVFAILLCILIVIAYKFSINSGLMTEVSYYHHTLFSNILFTSFVLVWISALFHIKKFIPDLVQTVLKRWSLNVNSIYIIHWIIISILGATMGFYSLSFECTILALIITIILSDIAAVFFRKLKG